MNYNYADFVQLPHHPASIDTAIPLQWFFHCYPLFQLPATKTNCDDKRPIAEVLLVRRALLQILPGNHSEQKIEPIPQKRLLPAE